MLNKIKVFFEDYEVGMAVIATLAFLVIAIGVTVGWYALIVWVASKIFGFAFKWIYVLGAWIVVTVLRSIFKTTSVKVEED